MALTAEQQIQVETDLAWGILHVHRPKTQVGSASARTVCMWCLVPWPCSQAEWAQLHGVSSAPQITAPTGAEHGTTGDPG